MFERTLSCSSLSKTYAVTGWRLGYVIAPPQVSAGIRKVHDFLTVGAPAPLQEAAVTALRFPADYYHALQAAYTRRREIHLDQLRKHGFSFTVPEGAYYVLVDISDFGFSSDAEFCIWMAREIGLAAVPGSSFFHEPVDHLIRLNFAKREETLIQVEEKLALLASKRP
jgi:aminotransferase